MKYKINPLPCPFCGGLPKVYPKYPETEGNAWAMVECDNEECPSQPSVLDDEEVADESIDYFTIAIKRWNTRA